MTGMWFAYLRNVNDLMILWAEGWVTVFGLNGSLLATLSHLSETHGLGMPYSSSAPHLKLVTSSEPNG